MARMSAFLNAIEGRPVFNFFANIGEVFVPSPKITPTPEEKEQKMNTAQQMLELAVTARTRDIQGQYEAILPRIKEAALNGGLSIRVTVPDWNCLKDIFERNGFIIEWKYSSNNDVDIEISWRHQ